MSLTGVTILYQSVATACNNTSAASFADSDVFYQRLVSLDDAFTIYSCFNELQTAAGDKLSYALVDEYSRLLAVIANDLQFHYFIVNRNTSIIEFNDVLLDIVWRYCMLDDSQYSINVGVIVSLYRYEYS